MNKLHNIRTYCRDAELQRTQCLGFVIFVTLAWFVSLADAKVYIDISSPTARNLPVAIASLHSADGEAAVIASKVSEIITSDLETSGILNILPEK